jgi:molybdenum cofactor cytidylyltransferase
MIGHTEITAFILAAGYSSRMGKFKPLLPLGPVTALERSVQLFRDTGIEDIRVVVGYRSEDLTPLLRKLNIRWVANERFRDGMLSSVKAGIMSLESSKQAFFLLPVDIPLIRPGTLVDLLSAYEKYASDVLYPCFFGKRGHPPLVSAALRPGILSWSQEGGLRSFLQQSQFSSADVEVADENILLDMDSPEQYEDICRRLSDYDLPSSEECMAILTRKFSVSEGVLAHSRKVAQVALYLTRALNGAGCSLNENLVEAASLLHDLAKGQRNHAEVAAQILMQMGYPAVANVAGSHMNIEVSEDQSINEKDVVFLADKFVQGDQLVGLEERHQKKLDECSNDSGACEAISVRLANSLKLKQKLETRLGGPIELVLDARLEDNHAHQTVGLPVATR